jgi:TPP-dependent pyruvate/acetoin dehydrogenase alpha subunit
MLTSEKLAEIETRVSSVIDEAVAFAENSPDPDPLEATTDLYA